MGGEYILADDFGENAELSKVRPGEVKLSSGLSEQIQIGPHFQLIQRLKQLLIEREQAKKIELTELTQVVVNQSSSFKSPLGTLIYWFKHHTFARASGQAAS